MAFYSGFFNSKGLDRTYTAEDFTTYLSSIICNGILDTYGDNFSLTAASTGLKVVLGTGKAWINGHYFVNDSHYSIDLTSYQDESLPRYVSIAIVCDTSENVRAVRLEIIPGTPAENPTLPTISTNENRSRLLLYAVRLNADAASLNELDWYDYRDDISVCGYCRCILGKCKVTEMLSQLAMLTAQIGSYNKQVAELVNKVDVLQTKVDDLTGDIIEAGELGENVYYVLYSDGTLLLRGTGDTYDYTSSIETPPNESPLKGNLKVKNLVVSDGITSLGDFILPSCDNLETASLPNSITRIGRNAFTNGLKIVTIPDTVVEIDKSAFAGTRLETLTIPRSVTTVGSYCFRDCIHLESVRYEGEVIGEFMFVDCRTLNEVTLANTVKEIRSHCFNYCDSLDEITYEGSLDDWAAVIKKRNWDGNYGTTMGLDGLSKVICLDGYMEYDRENEEWVAVSDYQYTVTADGVTIDKYIGDSTSPTVPKAIEGKQVTVIGDSAFMGTSIKSAHIPEGVEEIK